MNFKQLHDRYGAHVALRIQAKLSTTEFSNTKIDALSEWLGDRALNAQRDYQTGSENPFGCEKSGVNREVFMATLYTRWQEAEELSSLITIAEDVNRLFRSAS